MNKSNKAFTILGVLLLCVSYFYMTAENNKLLPPEFEHLWTSDSRIIHHSDSLFGLGVEKFKAGDYAEAINYFKECQLYDSINMKADDPRKNYAARWLAEAYKLTGNTAGYESYRNLIDETVTPIDRRLTARSDSLASLANFIAANDMAEAGRMYEEVADIERRAVGVEHPYLANSLYTLANVYINLGDFERAIKNAKEAGDIRKKCYGEFSRYYADALAVMTYAMHNSPSRELLISSIDLRKKLVDIYRHLNSPEEALNQYAFMAYAMNTIADIEPDSDNRVASYLEALALADSALTLVPLTDLRLHIFECLGNTYVSLNANNSKGLSTEEQLDNELKALDFYKNAVACGGDSATVFASHMRLGQYYSSLRDFDSAIKNFEPLVEFQYRHKNQYSKYLPVALYYLGAAYREANKLDKARKALSEASELATTNIGKISPENYVIANELCLLSFASGDKENVRNNCNETIGIAKKLYGEKSVETGNTMITLSKLLAASGWPEEAKEYTYAGWKSLKDIGNKNDNDLTALEYEVFERLVSLNDSHWEEVFDSLHEKLERLPLDNSKYMDIYATATDVHINKSDYESALACTDKFIDFYKKANGDNDSLWRWMMYKRTDTMKNLSRNMEAVDLATALIDSPGSTDSELAVYYHLRGSVRFAQGLYNEAIPDIKNAISYSLDDFKTEKYKLHVDAFHDLAYVYKMMGKYAASDSCLLTAYEKASEIFDKESPEYFESLVAKESTESFGDPDRFIDANLKMLEAVEKKFGNNSLQYASTMMITAEAFQESGILDKAIEFGEKALEKYLSTVGEKNGEYLGALVSMSSIYCNANQFELAKERAQLALDLSLKYSPNHMRILNAMQNLVDACGDDYGNALYQLDQMEKYARDNLGATSSRRLTTIYAAMTLNYRIGNFSEVRKLGERYMELYKDSDAPDKRVTLIKVMNIWGLTALATNDIDAAIKFNELCLENVPNLHSKERLSLLHNSAYLNFCAANTNKALELSEQTIKSPEFERILPNEKANMLLKQGYLRVMCGDSESGIPMMSQGLAIRDSIFDGKGQYVILGLADFVKAYQTLGDTKLRNDYAIRYSIEAQAYVKSSFLSLSAEERQSLWSLYSDFLMNDFPMYASSSNDDTMTAMAYDNLLLGKGLMLSTQREIKDIIQESDDKEMITLYDNHIRDKSLLDDISTGKRHAGLTDITDLKAKIKKQEFLLQKNCGDFMQPLNVHWPDVKKVLKNGEAAIEFAAYNDSVNNEHYVAFIVTSNNATPLLVELPIVNLRQIWTKNPQAIAESVWKPMATALGAVNKVYFSAAGDIYSVPIESVTDWEDKEQYIGERWQLVRLSSNREIVLNNNRNKLSQSVVYGGLKYDMDPSIIEADSHRYENRSTDNRNRFRTMMAYSDTTMRSGASYLPATLSEANEIHDALASHNVNVKLYSDTLGTESSFKALSGSSIDLIHIATHGFSWSEKESHQLKNWGFLNIDGSDNMQTEDLALSRCGLLFTGANNALKGMTIADGVDDGILSAREIANLDFRGVDMLILSACESGLGDISSEGVFGLQRGFKKAGVGSMLMSLWKVDDNATKLLMTKFYEHFLSGKSKQESLQLAQKFVREYEIEIESDSSDDLTASQRRKARREVADENEDNAPQLTRVRPYSNPRFWAAFILLDAI